MKSIVDLVVVYLKSFKLKKNCRFNQTKRW